MTKATRYLLGFFLAIALPQCSHGQTFSGITPPNPLGPYCAGATFNISFTLSAAPVGTATYRAELSNSSGAFSPLLSPTIVGSTMVTNPATGGTITVTIPAMPTSSNLYKIELIDFTGAIVSTSTPAFTINSTPSITTSPTNSTICSGGTTAIALTASEPSTFTWTATNGAGVTGAMDNGGSSIMQTLTSSNNAAQTTATYTVTPVSTAGMCPGTAVNFTVTINPTPVATTTPAMSATMCSGGTTNIALSASTPSTFAWTVAADASITGATTPGTGTPIAQTLTSSNNAAQTTAVYTITPTSTAGNCAGSAVVFTETLNPTPVVTSATSSSICSGASTAIALTASTPSSFSYTAANGPSVSGASSNNGTTINQLLINSSNSAAGTATYTLTPTSTTGSCPGAAAVHTVTVNPSPVITNSPLSKAICSGGNTAITITSSTPSSITYTATNGANVSGATNNNGASIAQMLTNSSNTTASTAAYTITPVSTVGTCTGAASTYTVTVNPIPVLTATPASSTICSGASTNITLSASVASSFAYSATPGAGVTGTSSNTGANISQMLSSSSSTSVATATYAITPTSTAGMCAGATTNYTVNINPAPVVTVSPAGTTICSGTAINVPLTASVPGSFTYTAAASAGVTGTFNGNNSTIAQMLTSSVNNAQSTATYTITPTATTGACPGVPFTYTVTINPTPAINGPLSSTICSGTMTNVAPSATTPSNFTYTGSNGPGITGASGGAVSPIGQTLINTGLTQGFATYAVTPTSTASCVGSASTFTVFVNPLPTATATPATSTICSGGTTNISLSANLPSMFAYTPINPVNTSNSTYGTGSNIAQTITNTTSTTPGTVQYSIVPTTTTAVGCAGPAVLVLVNVNPAPVVTTAAPAAICSGANTSIALSASTAGTNAFTFTAVSGSSITGSMPGSGTSIVQMLNNSGNSASDTVQYTITATSQQGCAGSSTKLVQTVNPRPVVTSASSSSICSGSTTSFALMASAPSAFAFTAVPGAGISGSSSNTGSTISQTLVNSSNTTAANVTYTVTPTSTAGCAGTASSTVVTVKPSPVVTSTTPNAVCNNGTLNFPLTASTTGVNAFSSMATNGAGIGGGTNQSGTTITGTLTNSSNTTSGTVVYAVTPTSALGCVGNPTLVTVTVNPTPVLTNTTMASACSGVALNIPLTASTGSNFTWTATNGSGTTGAMPSTGVAITQTLFNSSNVNTSTAAYAITPTSGAGCVGGATTITLTVNPRPAIHGTPWTDSICNFGTYVYDSASTGIATKYTWTVVPPVGISGASAQLVPNDTFSQTLINGTNSPITVPYAITPISPAGCPGNVTTLNLKVNPTGSIGTPSGSYTICSGASTAIALTSTTAGSTFTWTVIQGQFVSGASASSGASISQMLNDSSNSAPGFVQYNVISTTAGNCPGGTATYIVNVNPRPKLATPSVKDICSGKNTAIQLISTTGNGAAFTWTVSGNTSVVTGASGNAIFSVSNTAINQVLTSSNNAFTDSITYNVITQSAAGCISSSSDPVKVRVAPAPVVVVSTATPTFCSNSTTSIPLGATAPSSFSWKATNGMNISGATDNGGDTIKQFLVNADTAAANTATYVVTPVSTLATCTGPSKTITVTVRARPTINFPSTFYAICSGTHIVIPMMPSINPSSVTWTSVARPLITGNKADSLLFTNATGNTQNLDQILTNSTNNTSDTVSYIVGAISTSGNLRCDGPQKTIRVAVNPTPVLVGIFSKDICSQTRIGYTPAASTGTGATFTWTTGAASAGISGAASNSNPAILLNDSLVNSHDDAPGSQVYNITTRSAVGCSSASSTAVTINVNPLPVLKSAASLSVCSESYFDYTPASSVLAGITTFKYDRTANVLTIPTRNGITTTFIHDSLSSDHSLTASTVDYNFLLTSQPGCTLGNQHVIVTVNPTPDTPGISLVPETKICQNMLGANFGARRSAFANEVFAWSATNGAAVTQLPDSSNRRYALISFPQPGTSTILLRSKIGGSNACWNKGTTRQISIDGGGGSSNPNVVFFSNNLIAQATGVTHYQWGFDRKSDLDSTLLIGATNQNYPTTGTGSQGFDPAANNYWVLATFGDGCVRKAYFNSPALGTVPVAAGGSVAVRVYPNPATSAVTVELPMTTATDLHIQLYDLAGRLLRTIDASSNKVIIPTDDLTPGCYVVSCVQSGLRIATSRFIKQ